MGWENLLMRQAISKDRIGIDSDWLIDSARRCKALQGTQHTQHVPMYRLPQLALADFGWPPRHPPTLPPTLPNGEGFLPSGRVRLKLLACHLQDVSRCLQMSPVFHCINTDNEDRFQQVSPTFCRLRLYSVLLLSSDRTCASSGIHLLLNTNFKQSPQKPSMLSGRPGKVNLTRNPCQGIGYSNP